MRRTWLMILVAVGIGGGGWFFDHYSLDGLKAFKLRPRRASEEIASLDAGELSESARPLRIAAFEIRKFGPDSLEAPQVRDILAQVTRHFDLLVITDIDSRGADAVSSLVESVNTDKRRYDSLIGPATGRHGERRAAFVFDLERLEVDRGASYVVADPDRLLEHPPLVGWFRARGPSKEDAFTFSLMAIHSKSAEIDALGAAYRAVRDDGRGEDDVILAGDFGANASELRPLLEATRLSPAIDGVPTNTHGDRQNSNLLFSQAASEFMGKAGVMDLVRQFNLTVEQALSISNEMPIWAEFSSVERDRDGLAIDADSLRPPAPFLSAQLQTDGPEIPAEPNASDDEQSSNDVAERTATRR